MDLDFVSVHNNAKRELGQHPAILTSRLVNNIYIFSSLKLLNLLAAIFALTKITQSRPQFFSVNGSVICSGLHFWRHWFNMTKFLSKFGEQQLVMVNYACAFNQSETGKYFKWIIIAIIARRSNEFWVFACNSSNRKRSSDKSYTFAGHHVTNFEKHCCKTKVF